MKKVLSFVLLLVVALSGVFLTSCGETSQAKMLVPNGITLIAVGGLYDNPDIKIENVDGPDNLQVELMKKNYDIIIAPLNLGAKLYNAGKSVYKLDAMITFGNVYIVSKGAALDETLSSLAGKKIIAFGQNATPGIVLRAALKAKGVEADEIVYQNSVQEVVGLFTGENSEYDYALVAEPVLSQLTLKKKLSLIRVDLQEVLETEMEAIPQAGVFVNSESKRRKIINQVLGELKSNIQNLNQNPEEYAEKIVEYHEQFKALSKEVITSAIQNGNVIDYKKAKDNKDVLEKYFDLLISQNKNLLDKKPEESFYF
ncbi:MAG TPA: hypothetical protein VIL24_02930 [Clostridia bacterium]